MVAKAVDRIDELRVFNAVAELRSFAAASRRLKMSPAQVSKLVARLEDRLGSRLLNRTTRDVSLTDTGGAFQTRARALLDEFEQLERSAQETARPRGLLKISAPVSFANELGPTLLDFAAAYPDVGLDVSATDRMVNLVDEGFDVAVRIGTLADSSLVARRLATVRAVTVASQAYLDRRGVPKTPADLDGHDVIIDLNLSDWSAWVFGRGAGREAVKVSGRLRFANPYICVAAARSGFGISRGPAFAAAADLRAGSVVTVLGDYEPEPVAVHAVYPQTRHLPSKVRAFVDFLAERFSGEPAWHQGWH